MHILIHLAFILTLSGLKLYERGEDIMKTTQRRKDSNNVFLSQPKVSAILLIWEFPHGKIPLWEDCHHSVSTRYEYSRSLLWNMVVKTPELIVIKHCPPDVDNGWEKNWELPFWNTPSCRNVPAFPTHSTTPSTITHPMISEHKWMCVMILYCVCHLITTVVIIVSCVLLNYLKLHKWTGIFL